MLRERGVGAVASVEDRSPEVRTRSGSMCMTMLCDARSLGKAVLIYYTRKRMEEGACRSVVNIIETKGESVDYLRIIW